MGVSGMSRRRGFFAELQHQSVVADRNRRQAQAAAVRDQARASAASERARKAENRARALRTRGDAAALKAAEALSVREHLESRQAEVEALNSDLEVQLEEIDGLLSATLAVDEFVDLGALHKQAEHPPFTSVHERPLSPPVPIQAPPEPVFVAPVEPKGLSGMFGGKKKFHEGLTRAQAEFAVAHDAWQVEAGQVPMRQFEQMEEQRKADEVRQAQLEADMATYRDECGQRQRKVDEDNAELDRLIQDLAAGKPDAVEEYIGIVFVNSVYPDGFPGVANYHYDAATRELAVSLQFPRPEQVAGVKQYKYVKAKDEIAETQQTQKEQRERYSNVVNNMTLRTLHEMWESDRAGHIGTISLTGFVEHIDPATGKEVQTPLVALATERDRFLDIDLSRVTPHETLRHLDANLSKNPHGLVGIDLGQGVRGH
jgi:restriction system protein